jgi:hypothetical protein
MGGAPVLIRLFKNGIYVQYAHPSWFPCPVMLKKAHALSADELGNKIYYGDPDFKAISDAMPAVDTMDLEEHREKEYFPTAEDYLTWDDIRRTIS